MSHSAAVTAPSGDVVGELALTNFTLAEHLYSRGYKLPRHSHDHAYLTVVIEGTYAESVGGRMEICTPSSVRFLPPAEPHIDVYADGARCLHIKIAPGFLHGQLLHTGPGSTTDPFAIWAGARVYREFRSQDDLSALAIEGLLMELVAEHVRWERRHREPNAPRWLQQTREVLHDVPAKPAIADLAVTAGVHPVHLCREFRRYFGCTVGEYVRKLRVERACQLLASGNSSLAEIATRCGFSDQSHFAGTFKRSLGMTPGAYRESIRTART
jgi:AraC family transcriptional regulator